MSSPSSLPDLIVPSPAWQPVTFRGWRCNGSLDPLIRDYAHLGELCQHSPTEITEAGRICAIALRHNTYPESPESARAVFETWQAERRVPSWQRRPEHLPGIRTPAQFLAKHGNTHCRAACADAADLAHCAKLVGSYNGFDAPVFIRQLAEFNRRVFYNACNPNNGGDLFHFAFGWESSHVVYVEFNATSGNELNATSTHWRKLTAAQFCCACQSLGELTHADENSPVADDDGRVTWRLWWD
ncbi:MAG: hypothetical protein Q8N18_20205 [Opitutaceae bacterium]|nr:hypothetical protein [Opitutaceae bacterium]